MPFEESLLPLRPSQRRILSKRNHRDLEMLRRNTQAIGYAIAVAMPWRKYPEKPIDGFRTFGGSVLSRFRRRFVHEENCRMIDEMFAEDERTAKAIEVLLKFGDPKVRRMEMERLYGKVWPAHVLCSAIFEWCDKTKGIIYEMLLEQVFQETRGHWEKISKTVHALRWSRGSITEQLAAKEIGLLGMY